MMYAESREQALAERKKFEQAFRHSPKTIKTVVENWERLVTYYDYPREHWKHLRTSNVVESPFSGCGSEPQPRGDSSRSSTRPA